MASTYSPSLRLELIGDGDQSGIWGQTTNNNLGALVEQSVAGVITLSMLDANYTMSNFNGVVDEARNQVIIATGTITATRNLVAPLVEKTYVIKNSTTGGQSIQIIGSSGLGVTIPNGITAYVYCDGTNFYNIISGSTGNFGVSGNLTVAGTTALSGALTYGGVALSNSVVGTGSMALSASPAFTGTPTAPTATVGTNTTQLATTAFVIANAPTPPVIIPVGTVMLFYQAAAPTGWTQVTSLNDYDLRLVSGTGGTTGGTTAYSTVFTNQTPSFTGNNGSLGVNAGSLGTSSETQGGSVYLTGGGSINGHTLSTAQMPSHNHGIGNGDEIPVAGGNGGTGRIGGSTASEGGNESHSHGFNNPSYGFSGSSHNHSITGSPSLSGTISGSNGAITLNVRYANIIICSKN